ncbi:MAG: hypothetical protein LBD99_05765 [Candidatus Margulisbacteria bacterium]|jgi:hypothetical protein|nr:hypothetical protein [Candidatus Margulisiibacteriota bacterium]
MSELKISISNAATRHQAALRQADTTASADKAKTGNGIIDTDEEMLAAADRVSEIADSKFTGSSAQEAEAYLRRMVLGKTPQTAVFYTPAPKSSAGIIAGAHSAGAECPICVGSMYIDTVEKE